jgi:hypothetical protein
MKRLWLALLLLSCAPASDNSENVTSLCEAPHRVAAVPDELKEASGLAVSRRNPGILWTHNDGGAPLLFALDTLGSVRAQIRILDIENDDWEDIAVGSCDDGTCIYIGAIGDNLQARTDRAIHVIPEPAITNKTARAVRSMRYKFPEQAHDTEALFVVDDRVYLITKGRSGPITVYAVPAGEPGERVTLRPLQSLSEGLVQLPDMVTAAAAAPDGKHVLVRTYSSFQLYSFENEQLQPLADTSGYDLQALKEFQGEGADIDANGVIYLISERGLGEEAPPLSKVVCKLSAE